MDEARRQWDEVCLQWVESYRSREERRWISVDERLPQQGDTVWLLDGDDVLLCDYYRPADATKPQWFTHWSLILQPLPLPTLADVIGEPFAESQGTCETSGGTL